MNRAAANQRLIVALAAVVLCLAFLWQTISTLNTTSATSDEPAHIAGGYAQLATGRSVLNKEHPPLAKLIAAIPLYPNVETLNKLAPGWQQKESLEVGVRLLFTRGQNGQEMLTRARIPMILIGLLFCLSCFAWSIQLFGPAGGVTTLAACVFSPTIVAHSRLVTTDIPVAAFGIVSSMLIWRLFNQPSWRLALLAGVASGLAMASKFTGILFIPALILAMVLTTPTTGSPRRERLVLYVMTWITTALATAIFTYGWPPSPMAFLGGFGQIGHNWIADFQYYWLGQYSERPFPLYFPTAFVLKSTPAVLVSVILFCCLPLLRRFKIVEHGLAPPPNACYFLLLPPALYFMAMAALAPSVGERYIIPTYGFLFVALGHLGNCLWSTVKGRLVLAALLTVHAYSAFSALPDPISYFNGLFGCKGPAAVAFLDDSNIDWGQDLARVAEAVNRMRDPAEPVSIMYFGSIPPVVYLRNSTDVISPQEIASPLPRIYATSVHSLQRLMDHNGKPAGVDWLKQYKPVATIGNTYYIFDFRPKPR